jgi:hypothetical protein
MLILRSLNILSLSFIFSASAWLFAHINQQLISMPPNDISTKVNFTLNLTLSSSDQRSGYQLAHKRRLRQSRRSLTEPIPAVAMDEISKARMVFRRALTIEQQNLESEMKKCEHEIRTTLDEWRVRKTEIKALEEAVELKEVVKTAKIAISGRRAAAELMKYGVSHLSSHCVSTQLPGRY